jgi:hypothetical protein
MNAAIKRQIQTTMEQQLNDYLDQLDVYLTQMKSRYAPKQRPNVQNLLRVFGVKADIPPEIMKPPVKERRMAPARRGQRLPWMSESFSVERLQAA